jgi:hypothetical protein
VAGRLQQAELTVAILAHANAEITALGEPTAEKRAESDTGSARGSNRRRAFAGAGRQRVS